ncbi:MAG: adenosylcobalamin-dependent ribonucleoside-diphosphate reductase [Spirochaetia bacterium]
MKVERRFSGKDPYRGITWENRTSEIVNARGETIFRQENVVVPDSWSTIASDILAQKYFRKAGVPGKDGKIGGENDARQVFHRLAHTWKTWGIREKMFDSDDDAEAFYDEIRFMLARQMGAPNSPQWFNTGLFESYGITGPPQGHYFYNPDTKEVEESESAYQRPQPHACFILDVEDDLVNKNGIMDLVNREARLFKYGSGTGSNFSRIRGKNESLSGGGRSSGLLSFLKVADRSAGAIKSGGTTRRAAKMVTLDADHPDIQEYIDWKVREEQKVAAMSAGSSIIRKYSRIIEQAVSEYPGGAEDRLDPDKNKRLGKALYECIQAGIPESFLYQLLKRLAEGEDISDFIELDTDWQGESYNTVSGQTSNNSIRLPREFMEGIAENRPWPLIDRTTGESRKTIPVRDLWNQLCDAAWRCADPGVQFHSTINEWHTCPAGGEIRGSNPCSEYMFLDNTACNLASLNLKAFYDADSGEFHLEDFLHAVKIWTMVLEISVAMAQFPSPEIALKSYRYRTLGLGFANLGALLMTMGLPYDSDAGRSTAAVLSSIMTAGAYLASTEMARDLGPFEEYKNNTDAMLRVIRNHRRAALNREPSEYEGLSVFPRPFQEELCPAGLTDASRSLWDQVLEKGNIHGFRNAQVSAVAPTGTIGLLMDCDTTGIEPDYALVKYKSLAGGGHFRIINQSIPPALKKLGYAPDEIEAITEYIAEKSSIQGAPGIRGGDIPVFDTASTAGRSDGRAISWKAHIGMMAAVQPFISGAISKTVNMPASARLDTVKEAYYSAWKGMLKAVAIYRDGSKLSQPLSAYGDPDDPLIRALRISREEPSRTGSDSRKASPGSRLPLPARRAGYTQKAKIGTHSLFLRTGEYGDGSLGEIFLDMHKEGAAFRSLLNSFAIAVSLGLQYGVPLEEYVDAFTFTRFEPNGMVRGHANIKMATSVLDFIFRDLALTYLDRTDLVQVSPDDLRPTETDRRDSEGAPGDEDRRIMEARERGYEGDPCPGCGHLTLVRNGTCLKCETCGSTTGCS